MAVGDRQHAVGFYGGIEATLVALAAATRDILGSDGTRRYLGPDDTWRILGGDGTRRYHGGDNG